MKRICRENEQCVGGRGVLPPTGDTCDVETAMQPPMATPVPKSRRPHRGACLLPKGKKIIYISNANTLFSSRHIHYLKIQKTDQNLQLNLLFFLFFFYLYRLLSGEYDGL